VRRFHETLRGLGYAEGGNIVVERYSDPVQSVPKTARQQCPDVEAPSGTNPNDHYS
jgi:hypothetical protein